MLRRNFARWVYSLNLQASPTPNPRSWMFKIDKVPNNNGGFVPKGINCEVSNRMMSDVHPLMDNLFEQYEKEIMTAFISQYTLTVTLYPNVKWEQIEMSVSNFIGHYLVQAPGPIMPDSIYNNTVDDLKIDPENDSEVLQCIKELLQEQVRPMLQNDGGDMRLINWNPVSGVVSLELLGACKSCPSSQNTLKDGVERMMKHFLPEVTEVREVKNAVQEEKAYDLVIDSEQKLSRENYRTSQERIDEMVHGKRQSKSLAGFEQMMSIDNLDDEEEGFD